MTRVVPSNISNFGYDEWNAIILKMLFKNAPNVRTSLSEPFSLSSGFGFSPAPTLKQ